MFSAEILIQLGRGIAWVAENSPDDSGLGKRLLLVGAALIGAFWFLAHSPQWMSLVSLYFFAAPSGVSRKNVVQAC